MCAALVRLIDPRARRVDEEVRPTTCDLEWDPMREEPIVIDRVERVTLERACAEHVSESSEASRRVESRWSFRQHDRVAPDLAPQLMGWV